MVKYVERITDYSNIRCGVEEGVNAGKKIISVELSSVCVNPDDGYINAIDVINVFLALLTLFTICKVLYDYHAYRKTGQLPWLVSKMP